MERLSVTRELFEFVKHGFSDKRVKENTLKALELQEKDGNEN